MPVDFAASRKAAERAGMLGSGDYFKIKEGANRFRLMSECLAHPGEYQGKKNFKWLCYILDRADGKVKPFFMPHTIYKAIEALQLNPDYEFVDVPMPFDLTINAKGAGTKEVEYSVVPARKNTDLTAAERADLAQVKPLPELQTALREKRTDGDKTQPPPHDDVDHTGPVTEDEIPFAWLMPFVLPMVGLMGAGLLFV